jgi:hypothetical protein
MRCLFLLIIVLTQIQSIAQKWERRVYWNYSNINFFNEDIVDKPHYLTEENKPIEQGEINKEETYVAGDSLIIYLYRNRQKGSFGGVLTYAQRSNQTLFIDTSFLKNPFPFLASQRLTIQLNNSFLLKHKNLDSLLTLPLGSRFNNIEIIRVGKEPMLFIKYALRFQDSLKITTTDLAGKLLDVYKFYRIDPLPRIIKKYDLDEKYTFQNLLLKRDSFQLIQQDLPFEKNRRITVKPNKNDLLLLLRRYAGADTLSIQYQLVPYGDTSATWHDQLTDIPILQFTNLTPGKKYQLHLRYNLTPYAQNSYTIEIEQDWWQIGWVRLALAFLSGCILIGIGWFIYKIKKARQLKKEEEKRKQLDIQIRAVRSQLNPHFFFNALASVQSLINKNEMLLANNYLVRVSQLMRDTLEHSNPLLITMQEELKMLENYIEIEKLRFAFTYRFEIEDTIPQYELELPPMLLQPIIENAIKHGINGRENPYLHIQIFQRHKNLYIQISDNGKGFTINDYKEGFGLRLTKERIQLLNAYFPDTTIELHINSQPATGSRFTFVFNNWL